MRILTVCGSLQAASRNLELLQTAVRLAPEGVEVTVSDLLRHLPLFNPDAEATGVPQAVSAWRRVLAECDAVLIASPEYGHSLPGALKNGIDWVIGSGELYRKVVAVTAAVSHIERGQRGLDALTQTLRGVDAAVVFARPIVRGSDLDAQVQALLKLLVQGVEEAGGRENGARERR